MTAPDRDPADLLAEVRRALGDGTVTLVSAVALAEQTEHRAGLRELIDLVLMTKTGRGMETWEMADKLIDAWVNA